MFVLDASIAVKWVPKEPGLAQKLNFPLVTTDVRMAAHAQTLGITLYPLDAQQ